MFVALAPVSTSETALANETLVTALAYRSVPTQIPPLLLLYPTPPLPLIDCEPCTPPAALLIDSSPSLADWFLVPASQQ